MIQEFEIKCPDMPDGMSTGQYTDMVGRRIQSTGLSFSLFEFDCRTGLIFKHVYDSNNGRDVYEVLSAMVGIGIRIGSATIEDNNVVLQDVVYVNGAEICELKR
ncbi:MAG: hypothetical protein KAJ03_03490 [Gammaproteobacteria bacterium]|nr:hypothetical protein [Gammaproteobacteria bacterium]